MGGVMGIGWGVEYWVQWSPCETVPLERDGLRGAGRQNMCKWLECPMP